MQRTVNSNSNFTSTAAATAASISSGMSGIKCVTHIVIIEDVSGSMSSSLQKLTDAMNDVLSHLKEQFEGHEVTITIVTFSTNVQVVLPQTNLKNFSLIPPLHADGQTALNDAIKFVDEMIKSPEYDGRRIVITVTDGVENASKPENTDEAISAILRGYLETLSKPESSVTFILAGANQDTIVKVASFGLPPTSALNFNIGYVQGCANALGNMLGRVASGQDDTPSVQWDDRQLSCPMDDYEDDSPLVLTRTATTQPYVIARTQSSSCDYLPSTYDDDSTPSYCPS